MPYPRNIRLDADTEERLRSYIDDELIRHYSERGEWIEEIKGYQRDYWAKSKSQRATFPFTGASRLIIPIGAISVEAVHSRTMTTLQGLSQFVSAKAKSSQWADAAVQVERMMDHEIMGNPRNYDQLDSAVLECEKYGTGIMKSSYEYVTKTAVREIVDPENPDNVLRTEEFDIVARQGAVIDAVPIGRFVMPFGYQDAQTAPWCGEEHQDSPYGVRCMVHSGLFYQDVWPELEKWVSDSRSVSTNLQTSETEINQENLEKRTANWPRLIEWHELWLSFDVDHSGYDKEIVVHYHRQSGTFLSIRYNWHDDLHRPYRKGVYFPVEHRWTGVGICKQAEQFQKEITTMHRQRLDAGTISNMPMLKVHKLSGYGPKEPIFPGKMWFLDDMSQIEPFKMSEVSASAFSNEQSSVIYSQQRTGVNEVVLGMPQVGTPGTATSDLARIQEGNKKFDFAYKNIKKWIGEIIVDVACNIRQYGARNVQYYELVEGGQLAKAFFDLPIELIRQNFIIEIGAAGQTQNKILDRQNWQQVAVLLQQYYVGLLQLAQATGNQQLMQMLSQKGMVAATEAMKQLLESFDIRNIDRIIVSELLGNANQIANPQQLLQGAVNGGGLDQIGANAGRLSQSAGVDPTQGMDFINSLVQIAGTNGGNGVN